ncbi:FRG domain-containing protein [Mesorhizobium sp. ESP7-2]|nr:FRG domain-containing protein [Mesorhizobium sp. ESP7-2]
MFRIRTSSLDRLRQRRAARAKFGEFIEWIQAHPSERWVFRGQSQHWALRPSIGRGKSYNPEQEQLLFREFKRAAHPFVDRSKLGNNWDWLAVAQHHGLPTRLIDWTTNPLVACFFASQPSSRGKRDGEIVAVEARQIGYYFPDAPTEIDPFEITEPRFLRTPAVAARIISQRGLFSIHPSPGKAWYLTNKTERFPIPAGMKTEFVKALFAMGVDASDLMADLDGLATTLKWRFENRMLVE